jgi:hypothetical protein
MISNEQDQIDWYKEAVNRAYKRLQEGISDGGVDLSNALFTIPVRQPLVPRVDHKSTTWKRRQENAMDTTTMKISDAAQPNISLPTSGKHSVWVFQFRSHSSAKFSTVGIFSSTKRYDLHVWLDTYQFSSAGIWQRGR